MVTASSSAKTSFAGPQIHLRGRLVTEESGRLSIGSAPILYGLAVYTVLPVTYDVKTKQHLAFRLADHVRRLNDSAKIVGLQLDEPLSEKKFTEHLHDLLVQNNVRQDVLVRSTLFTDEVLAGTKSHGLPTSFSMYAYSGPQFYNPNGIHVCVSSWRRTPDVCIPSRAKINGSYINATLMKNQALAEGYDDAIALDTAGHVAESTVANIFIIRGGKLITPDPSADILEGITRDTVIQWAERQGIKVVQRQIDRSELYIADEIFITGTSARITPVLTVDKRPVANGRAGKLTKQLQNEYAELLSGKVTIEPAWITVL